MKLIKHILFAAGLWGMMSACHKSEVKDIAQPVVHLSSPITSDTLKGTVKGTMLAGKTYYFKSDITINDGDTLQMQAGVKLIAIGDGKTSATSPEIIVHGTFISLGTQDQPNWITVANSSELHTQAEAGNYTNVFQGYWGGLVFSPAAATSANPSPTGGDGIFKWTHLELAGGPAGSNDDPTIYTSGSPRYLIYFGNIKKNFIFEDSWVFGSKDDAIRVGGGKISIMRNTFEECGQAGGEFFNMKSGTVGDLAYNMMIGAATNALKASDAGSTGVQCNVNMYNNTILNCGYRQTKSGRGGSINFEKSAKGSAYNNVIANCRFGVRITSDADLKNVSCNNQLFYGESKAIVTQFYAADASPTISFQSNDIYSSTPQDNNPLFYTYDLTKFDYAANPGPLVTSQQPAYLVTVAGYNFRLQSNSPAVGKGKVNFQPLAATTTTGNLAAIVTLPGRDLGAYQTDGTGNQH